MYNPFPYDDPTPVNRPVLSEDAVNSLTAGIVKSAAKLAALSAAQAAGRNVIIAIDGYTTADFGSLVNLLCGELSKRGVKTVTQDFSATYKSETELRRLIDDNLSWDRSEDPTLLFGKIFHGGYQGIVDPYKLQKLTSRIEMFKESKGQVMIVSGYGCAIREMRFMYDTLCWLDITPKESMLRIRRGEYVNLGMKKALPVNLIIRRCYYADFEVAVTLRKELLRGDLIDWYFCADDKVNACMISREGLKEIIATMAHYPFRCKPVYLEGVWGGSYMMKLRNLPKTMRNCAWVFDMIPMEVSVMVQVGGVIAEFPFCTIFMKESEAVMGPKAAEKYHGYFPIRFNYDDSYHSTGNMSIQCHSGGKYNLEHYDELGRQDESYYVVVTGHEAKTFIGFRDDADIPQFFKDIEAADTEHKPVDYMKYISYEESKPGLQVMLPAGTVHSSGRNQVILEIGSLTVGSYTYKMYDYLRLDFDGKQRPIHTKLGELNVRQDRRASVIHDPDSPEYIVQRPRTVREGDGWKEEVLGENAQMYISLRRLSFDSSIDDDTDGKFHVLTVVDGDRVRIRSVEHPERYYDADFMDIVVVPASLGHYRIENLGKEPIRVHKTTLREGFENDPA
ncbi:MAG: phosphoheptose isomerase [Bacteroidales bacterium]|nr:phosphoheptose isomerase [Bacteroidales bacterium]